MSLDGASTAEDFGGAIVSGLGLRKKRRANEGAQSTPSTESTLGQTPKRRRRAQILGQRGSSAESVANKQLLGE